jgi:hypothetical protein
MDAVTRFAALATALPHLLSAATRRPAAFGIVYPTPAVGAIREPDTMSMPVFWNRVALPEMSHVPTPA